MTRRHQKKRNGLLIYEFLVQTISRALIEDDKRKSANALKIIRKYFKPGTELHKEFRLMNALAKTTVSSDHVAASILREAKEAATKFDEAKLDREKSLVIKHINHTLNDPDFYDQHVPEYRSYATIQSLVNEWKSKDKDVASMGKYEDVVMKLLTTEKSHPTGGTIEESSPGTARVLMKVMTRKLNEKYTGTMTNSQRALMKAYAYSTASDTGESIRLKLNEIKEDVVKQIDSTNDVPGGEYVEKKLREARDSILSEDLTTVDDDTITRFMLYSKLHDELTSKDDGDE